MFFLFSLEKVVSIKTNPSPVWQQGKRLPRKQFMKTHTPQTKTTKRGQFPSKNQESNPPPGHPHPKRRKEERKKEK